MPRRLLDVRRFAALDLHGVRGSALRLRLVGAELVLAAVGMPLLGVVVLLGGGRLFAGGCWGWG